MMKDKRKEELKEKAEAVSACLGEVTLQNKEFSKVTEILEFLDKYCFYNVLIEAVGIAVEYRIPLSDSDRNEVVDVIRKKLEKKAKEYGDGILRQYKELDGLLK